MTEKRKRAQNFTFEEKDKLIKIVFQYKDIILNRKTDTITNEIKSAAWTNIAAKFNRFSGNYRTKKSLVRVWEKMKGEAKCYYNRMHNNTQSHDRSDLVMEQIFGMMDQSIPETPSIVTSNGDKEISNMRSPKSDNNSSDEDSYPLVLNNVECVIETPNCSPNRSPDQTQRQRPSNGLSESSSTNSSFNLNEKRLEIEAYRKQLLEQELEYKKQLYKQDIKFKKHLYRLQVKAAEHEVKIKEEVLARIIDGRVVISNLFGSQETTKIERDVP